MITKRYYVNGQFFETEKDITRYMETTQYCYQPLVVYQTNDSDCDHHKEPGSFIKFEMICDSCGTMYGLIFPLSWTRGLESAINDKIAIYNKLTAVNSMPKA